MGIEDRIRLWAGKVLLSSGMSCEKVRNGGEDEFLQYVEHREPLDDSEKRLGCLCLRWSTDE